MQATSESLCGYGSLFTSALSLLGDHGIQDLQLSMQWPLSCFCHHLAKMVFLCSNLIYKISFDIKHSTVHALYFDPNIAYSSVYRQYYFVPMLLLNLLFVFLPMLFLLLYSTRVCRRVIHCVCSGRMRSTLFLFMDNFQGCYKNGTAGTYDYKSASCLAWVCAKTCGCLVTASKSFQEG